MHNPAAAAAAAAAIIDPSSAYSAYHHPHAYYRVAQAATASSINVKDFGISGTGLSSSSSSPTSPISSTHINNLHQHAHPHHPHHPSAIAAANLVAHHHHHLPSPHHHHHNHHHSQSNAHQASNAHHHLHETTNHPIHSNHSSIAHHQHIHHSLNPHQSSHHHPNHHIAHHLHPHQLHHQATATAAVVAAAAAAASSSSESLSPPTASPASVQSAAAQAAAVQTRILEMRKEKSRDAARSRRGKENHEFYELAKMLPLPAAITSQLDKASIIRLTISYLKLREFSQNGEPSWNQALSSMSALKCKANSVFESHQGTHILQSLDGFAFALGQDGRFLYISETVSIYLGLSQVEMTGSSIFDYTHQQDHAELAEQLGLNHSSKSGAIHHHPSHPNHPVHQQQSHLQHSLHPPSHHQHHHSNQSHHSASPLPPPSVSSNTSNESESGGVVGPSNFYSNGNNLMQSNGINDTFERQFCIRMKSTLTKRGCQHFKSSGYRVVNIVAHLRTEMLRRPNSGQINGSSNTGTNHSKIIGLVALAIALPPPSINELRLEPDMFVTRHSLDFKIIHCEQRVTELLNYCPEELIGRNFYSLIHGQDVSLMKKCHLDLLHKGQSMSGYYRIINKSGGYTWVQTCATLICNNAQANFVGQSGTAVTVCTNKSSSSTSSLSSSTSPSQISQNGNNNNNNNNGYNNSGQQDATTNSNLPNSSQQQQQQQEDQEQSVICVNYVLSAIEYIGVIMDSCQLGQKVITSTPMTKIRSGLKKSHSHASSPEIKLNNTLSSSQISSNDGNQNSRLSVVPAPSSSSSSSSTRPTASPKHETSVRSSTENIKRRRLNSSPVRPWKSPSPQPNSSGSILGAGNTNESNLSNNSPNLLRHISVIRETPPILKPQVMTPNPYHPHHYHHLVDQYASAYHLYKTGPNSPQGSDSVANPVHHASHHHHPPPHPHHWSTYGC